MTIELISQEQYERLLLLQKEHPMLTFQNKGYEYIDKSKLSEKDVIALKEIEDLLKIHIKEFVEFNNFLYDKAGRLGLRVQYNWDERFTGVGYLYLTELLNGFETKE